jgi:hypothetical protein
MTEKAYFVKPDADQVFTAKYFNRLGQEGYGSSFTVVAHIYDPDVRYRQYVRGFFKCGNDTNSHQLDTGLLDPKVFREDRVDGKGYGDAIKAFGRSVYNEEIDEKGQSYREFVALDAPGIPLPEPGTTVEIYLVFNGVLVDENKNVEHDRREWVVQGTFTAPASIQTLGLIRTSSAQMPNQQSLPTLQQLPERQSSRRVGSCPGCMIL